MAESTGSLVDLNPGFAEGSMALLRNSTQDEPKRTKMDPDRTYITVLPGHSRPAFVRKPRRSRENPFGLTAIARALAPAPRRRRSYSAQYLVRVRSYSPTYSRAYVSPPPPLYYQTSSQPTVMTHETVHTYPTSVQYSPPVLEQQGVSDLVTTKVITHNGRAEDNTLQHTCSACGKYRSASYQSRHPLAPGEIPKPGTCRHCIRKHTSSEDSEQEARRLRRLYRYDKCRKRSRYQYRYGRDAHSTATYSSSSPSKEEIQVHETRLISHDRHRSSSSSRDKARIRVTIEPERRRRGRRRESIEPVNVIKRTRHVDQGEWSRSRSRDSRRFDHEHPNSIQVCKDDHGRTTRHMVAQSYQPREFRTIEYGYDGNLPREGKTTRPVIRRRSASSLDQHTARYRIEEKETIESRERSYCRPNSIQRRNMDRSYTSRSSDTRCRERPTNSVRILRMSQETEDEIRTYNSEPPALQRRVSFVEDRSPSCSSTRRQLGEQKNPVVIHRRREVRDTHSESSDEVSLHEAFPYRTRSYSTFQPQRERLLPGDRQEEEYELIRDFDRTRITPTRRLISPLVATPRRMEHHHACHYERSTGGSAGEDSRHYYHVPDGAVFYRDV